MGEERGEWEEKLMVELNMQIVVLPEFNTGQEFAKNLPLLTGFSYTTED